MFFRTLDWEFEFLSARVQFTRIKLPPLNLYSSGIQPMVRETISEVKYENSYIKIQRNMIEELRIRTKLEFLNYKIT